MADLSDNTAIIDPPEKAENIQTQEPPVVDTKAAEVAPPITEKGEEEFELKPQIKQRNVKSENVAPKVEAPAIPKYKAKGWESEDDIVERNEVDELRKTAKALNEIPDEVAAALHLSQAKGVSWKDAWKNIESLAKTIEVPKIEVEGKQVLDKDFIYEDAAKALFLEGVKLEKTQKGRVFDEAAAIELFEEAQEKPNRLIETLEDYAEKINENNQKELNKLFEGVNTGGRKEAKEAQEYLAEREVAYNKYAEAIKKTVAEELAADEKEYYSIPTGEKDKNGNDIMEDVYYMSRTKEDDKLIEDNVKSFVQARLEYQKAITGETPELNAKAKKELYEAAKDYAHKAFKLANDDRRLAAAEQRGYDKRTKEQMENLGAGVTSLHNQHSQTTIPNADVTDTSKTHRLVPDGYGGQMWVKI